MPTGAIVAFAQASIESPKADAAQGLNAVASARASEAAFCAASLPLSPASMTPDPQTGLAGALRRPNAAGQDCSKQTETLFARLCLVRSLQPRLGDSERLIDCCRDGNAWALEALVYAQAPISMRVSGGQTPLMLAVMSASLPCVRLLLSAGADVNAADDAGTTALHLAAALGDLCMLRYLCVQPSIKLGARLCTSDAMTAQQVAAFAHHTQAAAYLACCERQTKMRR